MTKYKEPVVAYQATLLKEKLSNEQILTALQSSISGLLNVFGLSLAEFKIDMAAGDYQKLTLVFSASADYIDKLYDTVDMALEALFPAIEQILCWLTPAPQLHVAAYFDVTPQGQEGNGRQLSDLEYHLKRELRLRPISSM